MSAPSSAIAAAVTRAWRRRGPLACLLWPLSLPFALAAAVRRALYRAGWLAAVRLPVPVIVVGNVYVGGTGKTPLVIWLVQALAAAGHRPGVVSRGYGASGEGPRPASAGVAQAGDEPVLIAARGGCPVMVGRDRPAAARALLAAHPGIDVIVADDGLQHYPLARDIEIVLFDERGVGNGWLLPAGPLREPASRRRDFTVLNAADGALPPGIGAAPYRMRLAGTVAERLIDPTQKMPLTGVAAPARVLAAAGIGNPARFFTMLRAAGLKFAEMPLPDHYPFSDDPFAGDPAEVILITEKDAVKCRRHPTLRHDPRLWVVPVTAQIDDALAQQILEKLRGHPTA